MASSMTSPLRPLLRAAAGGPNLAARTFTTSSPRSLARMIITGRLTNTPELQTTATGNSMIRYSVASDSGPRDKRLTSFFRVASFLGEGSQRDYLLGLPKGTLVFVEGDASLRQWEDSEGKRQSALNIVQRNIEVLKRPTPPNGEFQSQYQSQSEFQNPNESPQ